MKKIFIILFLLFFCACSPHVHKVCRHYAIDSALTWGDLKGESTLIVVGWNTSDNLHAETITFHDGQWFWLVSDGEKVGLGAIKNEESTAKRFNEILYYQEPLKFIRLHINRGAYDK